MSATEVCALAWHIQKCGVTALSKLALNPDRLSFKGNASRKLSLSLGLVREEQQLCRINVAMASELGQREHQALPVNLLHELLIEEYLHCPDAAREAAASLMTVPNWVDNAQRIRLVKQGFTPIPYGIFIDGAAWRGKGVGQRDSVINYVVNLCGAPGKTPRRTLLTVRKEKLCGSCMQILISQFPAQWLSCAWSCLAEFIF